MTISTDTQIAIIGLFIGLSPIFVYTAKRLSTSPNSTSQAAVPPRLPFQNPPARPTDEEAGNFQPGTTGQLTHYLFNETRMLTTSSGHTTVAQHSIALPAQVHMPPASATRALETVYTGPRYMPAALVSDCTKIR